MNDKRNVIRFVLILFVIIIICGLVFWAVSIPRHTTVEQSEGGILDLTTGDITSSLFTLDGEWEFYYGEMYTPADFDGGGPDGKSFVSVPMSWHAAGYPLHGCATYRIVLKTDEPELMMLIPDIRDSSIVWVNGQKVFEAGKPGKSSSETVPGLRNGFIMINPEGGLVDIVVQAANYGWYVSGLQQHIEVARPGVLLFDAMLRRILLGLVVGVMLGIAVYHAILAVYNRRERVYLVFSLLCLVVAARFFVDVNSFASLFLPGGMGYGLILLYSGLLVFQVALIVVYIHLMFGLPVGKVRLAFYCAAFAIPLFAVMALPYGTANFQIGYLAIIPMVVAFVDAARKKDLAKNPFNMMLLFLLGVFIMWYPVCKLVLKDELYVPDILSNLLLVFTQCFMLSVSYAETRRREEFLAERTELLDGLNRSKTEFLRNMSHELKTPLTVISVHVQRAAELYEDGGGGNPVISGSLHRAQDEIMRAARMAESALWLASTQESREENEPLDMAELLINSAEAYRAMIEKRGNMLSVDVAPELPQVYGSADKLIQVMANLLTNANAHTTSGKITVSAEADEGKLTVTVADDGAGVPPELLPRVFERGVTGSGGAGVGLEICKSIIESHGGAIWIESNAGEGTAVSFSVPIVGVGEIGESGEIGVSGGSVESGVSGEICESGESGESVGIEEREEES